MTGQRSAITRVFALALATALVPIVAHAQVQAPPSIALPVAGTTSAGGTFSGTLNVARFAQSDNQVVAVGAIKGIVADANGRPVGSMLNAPVMIPVTASQLTGAATRSSLHDPVETNPLQRVGFVQVQVQTCGILHLALGAITLDALGVTLSLTPIAIDLTGAAGNPTDVLGTLVCQALASLTNVGNLVGLLNQLVLAFGGQSAAFTT